MKAKRIIIYSVVLAILVAAFTFCAINVDAAGEVDGMCGDDVYWVIMIGSVAIVVGVIAMYVGKLEALSVKKVSVDTPPSEETDVSN